MFSQSQQVRYNLIQRFLLRQFMDDDRVRTPEFLYCILMLVSFLAEQVYLPTVWYNTSIPLECKSVCVCVYAMPITCVCACVCVFAVFLCDIYFYVMSCLFCVFYLSFCHFLICALLPGLNWLNRVIAWLTIYPAWLKFQTHHHVYKMLSLLPTREHSAGYFEWYTVECFCYISTRNSLWITSSLYEDKVTFYLSKSTASK